MSQAAPWRIDVHQHVVPPQFVADTPLPMEAPDVETHLHTLDEFGIRAAIVSLTPRVMLKHPERRVSIARACNEHQAGMIQQHPDRFGAFAILPLPDVDSALKEIEYSLDTLKLDGIGMFSNFENKYLGDPLMDPVFDELNRRKATIFVHPAHCGAPPELNLQAPGSTIEYIFDTTRAIVNLLFTKTFYRCPDIRIIFSHAGGAVPYLTQRISGLEQGSGVPDVIGTLKSLYYDIASASGKYALPSLQALADPTHILFGSDYPFVFGPRLQHEIDYWTEYDGLDQAGKNKVEVDNALALFPRLSQVGVR